MCVKVGQGTGVALIESERQVLVLGQLILSFERVDNVLVGTHTEVTPQKALQVAGQLEALAAEWQAS